MWIAIGHADMRCGMQSLAAQVQQHFLKDSFAGDLWVFRGRSGSLEKIIWPDGIGMSLYANRLQLLEERFNWQDLRREIFVVPNGGLGSILDDLLTAKLTKQGCCPNIIYQEPVLQA
ncbi:MAG: IS66 family insertion sequence element accessory protein TnpB [Sphingomonas sp.]